MLFRHVNSTLLASIFSLLTALACTGIILFLYAIRMSKRNAVRHGLYMIFVSFICGAILMGWALSTV